MINPPQLLADLTRLLKRLEDDLRLRIEDLAELKTSLQVEWQAARDADRTAETFESWADQVITQAGVHWLLSCVFLRFIEDNELVERPWLSGTPESGRLALARDRHEAYFLAKPLESDRDYLLACFREASALPGLHTFFDERHNPAFRLGISGDAAMALRQFWQQVSPNTGSLAHDFTDPTWNTRFLGDLYQDLSEATRKRYALLQTPEFVEEFILDRTLTPAIREFGFREVRMIDPTCGSGHFLLGGFHRLVKEWTRHEPARNSRNITQRALNAVAGVDLNPFAVAISRFRLLVAALLASDVRRLSEAPDFHINVAIGDSLLHGKRFGLMVTDDMFQGKEHFANTGLGHAYATEDLGEVQRILGTQYHAVVGNPPYIVVKDAALNAAYRRYYASCHRQYSLGVPFTQRFFELAITGRDKQPAGYVGLISANSFMKREFGSKLIEQVLPRLDLTHVVDTSGAYIPGHGIPTAILFGRHRMPFESAVRTVMGIKGEPGAPDDASLGLVWTAILSQIDHADSESSFVSVADIERAVLGVHPWSIGGGGAKEVKESIEACERRLGDETTAIGRVTHTGADDVYFGWSRDWRRRGVELRDLVPLVEGDVIRDWTAINDTQLLFPYDSQLKPVIENGSRVERHLWTYKQSLSIRREPGGTHEEIGLTWFEWSRFQRERFLVPLSIGFAFVATHNHFVLDRGGRVFNRSAPVIKLPATACEEDHLGLLGLLNSSIACFWCQQVCHNKGGPGGGSSKDEKWHDFYEFSSTALREFPLSGSRPIEIARQLDRLANDLAATLPMALLSDTTNDNRPVPTRADLNAARTHAQSLRRQMIAWQEELDWHCYGLYDLLPSSGRPYAFTFALPPQVAPGERAFEIVIARRVSQGRLETRWFEWLGITPTLDIPDHWPEDYRQVVARRIELINSDRSIGLLEGMNCKRRWETSPWADLERNALRASLLDLLESPRFWHAGSRPAQVTTTNRLADAVRDDADFMGIAALYRGHADFNLSQLIVDLVVDEAVPFLPALRHTSTGLRIRAQWEHTWAIQRREDAGELVGKIPIPPKYHNKDFLNANFWRLRGGFDVPKERWVSFPGCERGADTSLPIAWAGWNQLQHATALAAYYLEMKDTEGWRPTRLQPLLAGLLELVPWLEQWHNEIDPVYGERMGAYYKSFVNQEAQMLGFTLDDLRTWKPLATSAKRVREKTAIRPER